jgi:hypothetical protein
MIRHGFPSSSVAKKHEQMGYVPAARRTAAERKARAAAKAEEAIAACNEYVRRNQQVDQNTERLRKLRLERETSSQKEP